MGRVGCNVLIVDDDADTREALAAALADAGFHVEQADSGKQALECMEKQGEPDVLLLDLRMPRGSSDSRARRSSWRNRLASMSSRRR